MPDSSSWYTAAMWGRLDPSRRIVWCRAAGVDAQRCLVPWAQLTMPEKVELYVALCSIEEFAFDLATV